MRALTCSFVAVFILFISTSHSNADWINLSGAETSPNIAEITVLDDRVRLVLEIFVDDISELPELLPDEWLRNNSDAAAPLEERMISFSRKKFQVIADDEEILTARLRLSEPRLRKDRASPFAGMVNPITRQKTPEPPADKRVLYVELEYPFDGKPETLTFVPPPGPDGRSLLPIGFIAYHKSVPVIDFRYLTGAVTLKLDWQDPWYSKFQGPNLKRHHRWPMMSFLYLEPREVRHEVIVRLRDLDDWISLQLKSDTAIASNRQKEIREAASRFFLHRNPVEIDGVSVKPASVSTEFLKLSLTGVQVIEEEQDLDPTTAVLGVILSYPVEHLPKSASVQWDLFNERITRVPAMSVDPAGPFPSEVAPTDTVHTWTNHLLKYQKPRVSKVRIGDDRTFQLPILSITVALIALVALAFAISSGERSRKFGLFCALLFGLGTAATWGQLAIAVQNPFAGPPEEAESKRAIEAILNNANAAFQEVDKTRLQSQLELFLDSSSIAAVTAELDRAINIKVAGGTTARVGAVDNVSVTEILPLEDGNGFSALTEWTAEAKGQHWGHTHLRSIRYRAQMDLVEHKDEWRLAGLTVLNADLLP
ncbi:hypothetical protein ABLO27_18280 [Roseibium sp. SCPC15]|uniref:hypothetical protein n=1 Tax=Roseibium sp. SCP15 TaxID=3141376 RepID=UPI00333BAD2E